MAISKQSILEFILWSPITLSKVENFLSMHENHNSQSCHKSNALFKDMRNLKQKQDWIFQTSTMAFRINLQLFINLKLCKWKLEKIFKILNIVYNSPCCRGQKSIHLVTGWGSMTPLRWGEETQASTPSCNRTREGHA